MKSRWLSTFTLIGVLLLILGAVGLVFQHTGSNFVFDPGQPPPADGQDHTALYYLVIGALMVLNGLVLPAVTPAEAAAEKKTPVSASRTPSTREAVAAPASEPGE